MIVSLRRIAVVAGLFRASQEWLRCSLATLGAQNGAKAAMLNSIVNS